MLYKKEVSWRETNAIRILLSLCCNLHPPHWMNRREHKDGKNNIQALRGERKGGLFLANVMDKGVAHRVIVVLMVL